MHDLISQFPQHIAAAVAQGKSLTINRPAQAIQQIVVAGMGGSGIAANLVQQTVASTLNIPFIVSKEYTLPQRVGPQTLVIVSSYSGNTEETIAAMEHAYQKKAMLIAITSGGRIQELAQQYGAQVIALPVGFPPRACFGYSLVLQLYILLHLQLTTSAYHTELETLVSFLQEKQSDIKQQAEKIARTCANDVIPVIYSSGDMQSVAVRFCQQIQENAKVLCRHNIIPEMNHNEINGREFKPSVSVQPILLKAATDHPRVQKRFAITKTIIEKAGITPIEISAFADAYLVNALYLVHLTDWVSVYMADALKRDPTQVKVIDFLKGELLL